MTVEVSDILADLDAMILDTRRLRTVGLAPATAYALVQAENTLRICREKWRSEAFAKMVESNKGVQHDNRR